MGLCMSVIPSTIVYRSLPDLICLHIYVVHVAIVYGFLSDFVFMHLMTPCILYVAFVCMF